MRVGRAGEMVMADAEHVDLKGFMAGVTRRNPGQTEFIQAVQEVAEDVYDFIDDKPDYHRWQILRRIAEPDRVISFRVCWEDDRGNVQVNRGYRVQAHSKRVYRGPYRQGTFVRGESDSDRGDRLRLRLFYGGDA